MRRKQGVRDITPTVKDGTVKEMYRQRKAFWRKPKRPLNELRLTTKDTWKIKSNPDHVWIVTMHFANGTQKTWAIETKDETFTIKKKMYHLFYEECSFDISLNQYHLHYHEDFAVPINREIRQEGDEAYFTVKPSNLGELIKFNFVKVLTGAHSILKQLSTIIVLTIVNIVLTIVSILAAMGVIKFAG